MQNQTLDPLFISENAGNDDLIINFQDFIIASHTNSDFLNIFILRLSCLWFCSFMIVVN